MFKRNYPWFIVSGGCIIMAALISLGRSGLKDILGNSLAYGAVIALAYILLGCAAGTLTKAFSRRDESDTDSP